MRELGCPALRGNGERWLLEGVPPGNSEETRRLDEIAAWARERLSTDELGYLAALPETITVGDDDAALFCFHGSPRSDVESLLATTSDDSLDKALAGAASTGILAGGHTHLQLLRVWRDRLLLNPGSVGLPLGSLVNVGLMLPARAEYAVVDVEGGKLHLTFRRVDVDVTALAAKTATMPHSSWAADLARRIGRWNARAPR